MGKVEVSNEELRTIRDAMRELNRMIDGLETGELDKVVLCSNHRMRAVVLSLDTYARLVEMAEAAELVDRAAGSTQSRAA